MASVAHERMRVVLVEADLVFAEEVKMCGHRIDFVVDGWFGVDVNGDRWHRWSKIVECDRIKLDRVFEGGGLVLGVWWSRLQASPESVVSAIRMGVESSRLAWWDWSVPPERLSPTSFERVKSLVVRE